jgi:hypothetical protein
MAYIDDEQVVEQLTILQQEPTAFQEIIPSCISAAHSRITAMLSSHFDTTTTANNFLKETEAKLAAVLCIKRKSGGRNVKDPQMVAQWQMEVLRDIKNMRINENDRQYVACGLTALGEPSDTDALAKGVMDDKRASIDRGDPADWWEPADDSTTDDDSPLGDESVHT